MWFDFFNNIIGAFLGAGVMTGIFGYLLENRRRKEIEKEKAVESVVDFLTEWIKSNYITESAEKNEVLWKLQSMYWKTILRLDKEILDVLIPLLAHKEDAVSTNEIIVEIRKALLGLKKPDLKPEDLNNWLPKK